MLVMCHCKDNSNQQQVRMTELAAHLNWVENNMHIIKVAGPLLDDNTQQIIGSLYILEAENKAQAEQYLAQDPYYKANIWQQITIKEFKDYAGTWVGGKNWPGANAS